MDVEVVSELIVVVVEMWRRRGGQEEESGGGDEVDLGSEADGMRDTAMLGACVRPQQNFSPARDNYLNCANLTIRQQDSCCVMLSCYKSGECFTVYSMHNDTEDSASICCG